MKRPLSEQLLSPLGVLTASIVVWALCLLLPFNTYTIEQSPEARMLLVGFVGAFIAGTLVWRRKPNVAQIRKFESPRAQRVAFTLILFIGAIGLALRFYDLLFVRHFTEYESVAAFRLAEVESGPQALGAIGAISVLLFPVGLVAFALSLYLHKVLFLWQRLFAFVLLCGFLAYLFAQGGRTLMVTGAIICASVIVMRGFIDPSKQIDNRRFAVFGLALVVAFAGFVGYSAYVLQSRLHNMGVADPHAFLSIVEEDRGYRINEPYRSLTRSPEPAISTGVLTASSLTYYINHGYFDFSELFESEKANRPMGGVMQFAPVVRFLNSAGIDTPSTDEGQARIPRPGLFYTFFGNVLIDFGVWGGLIYCFLFGMFVQALWLRAKAGAMFALMLYPFFVSVIFHFPMLDMISGGYGLFVAFDIVAAIGALEFFRLVFRARRRRRVVLQAA